MMPSWSDRAAVFDGAEAQHDCVERQRHINATHRDWREDEDFKEPLYGPSVLYIERVAGRWWAHNREYSTEVSYCPWCGIRLTT